MIRIKNIKWYLEDPTRLLKMKPFVRGGQMQGHGWEMTQLANNSMIDTGFCNLNFTPISQDTYITEYRPSLHNILINKSIPHIKVTLDGAPLNLGMMDMTQTCSFQKLIHSAHVRSLTANAPEFNLGKTDTEQGGIKSFELVKDEWEARNMDWWLSRAISAQKMVGNCGLLFSFDKEKEKTIVTSYSYEDGYQIIPNYDEYGYEVARTLAYEVDGKLVLDAFDEKMHYRCVQGGNEKGWDVQSEVHGFSRCPLLTRRGTVAWEYAESSCEMWELMSNINNIALKRFGTFALVFTGEMDKYSFKRDSSTLVINLSSDTSNGKQSADVLKFPEPTTMNEYLKALKEEISLFSSTSFITPKDIQNTGSGGNGIALAMSNDYALATQSALDWRKFLNDMVYLHQEGLDLEQNAVGKLSKLRIQAKIIPWSLETNNTKVTNLAMEAKWLSMRTIIEKSPDAAPDEVDRIIEERGALVPQGASDIDEDSDKALRISRNNSNIIRDNVKKDEEK